MLDRSSARHVRGRAGRLADGAVEVVRVALGVGEVERRDDVPVEDPGAAGPERLGLAGRNDPRGSSSDVLKALAQCPSVAVGDAEDDREAPVRALAEVALEH